MKKSLFQGWKRKKSVFCLLCLYLPLCFYFCSCFKIKNSLCSAGPISGKSSTNGGIRSAACVCVPVLQAANCADPLHLSLTLFAPPANAGLPLPLLLSDYLHGLSAGPVRSARIGFALSFQSAFIFFFFFSGHPAATDFHLKYC